MLPEVVVGVLDELNEGDEQSPGMGSVHYQPLQQYPTQAAEHITDDDANTHRT